MLAKSSPVLGSFDVLQLYGTNPQVPLPGVQEQNFLEFCLQSEADALAALMSQKLNAGTDGSNGSVSVTANGEMGAKYIPMVSAGPAMFNIQGTYTSQQKTYTVSEKAGPLLDRQKHPNTVAGDQAPYKNPDSPELFFEKIGDATRFAWR